MTKPWVRRLFSALILVSLWLLTGATLLFLPAGLSPANASSLDARPSINFLSGQSKFVLDATRMAANAGLVTYLWTLTARPAGSLASLSGADGAIAQLSADGNGPFTVELVLSEGGVARAPIALQLRRDNVEPVSVITAAGGAAPATQGLGVTLSAAGSYDPDGDRLLYQWSLVSKPAGSAAVMNTPAALNSTFTPDVAGAYKAALTVTDKDGITATDTLQIVTGKGLTIAEAGPDQSAPTGSSVFADAFQSIQTQGQALAAQWRIVSAPAASSAALVDGASLDPKAAGRQSLTPAVSGLYVLGVSVSGGGGAGADTIAISAGPGANVAPRANAGAAKAAAVGAAIALDATGSTDFDGDALTYRWSLVTSPGSSAATIADPALPRASFTPDMAGLYVAQLSVSDGRFTSHTTISYSTSAIPPIAAAGPDKALDAARTANVGATAQGAGTAYSWAVTELGTPSAASAASFSAPANTATQVSFADIIQGLNPAAGLLQHELIVFENANIRSQVYGRTFIGGNLQGLTSDYGNGLVFNSAPANVVLKVGGQINGQRLNINNGGSVSVKGSVNARINLNGGGRLVTDPSISIAALRQQLETFSTSLAAMQATGAIAIPTGQPGPVTINAVPNAKKIAVFNVDGNALFDNPKVQQISLNLNGADAIVINVAGNNVKLRQANLVGNCQNASVYSKVIWNFKDAVNVQVDRSVAGTILAPKAQVLVNAQIKGGVVSRSINQQAAIATPGFLAIAPFAPVSAKVDAAVVQVKAVANGLDAFDTALVTRFNIAPVGAVNLSSASVDPGAPVTLNGAASADANGDALTFKWALLSKPAGSLAMLGISGTAANITPDKRGRYIVQLTASDGRLASEPVTAAFTARNRIPAITSIAPAGGIAGAAYAYAAAGSDADGDSLTWSLVSGPAGMQINPTTGGVAWTPDAAGSFQAVIKASDGFGGEAAQSFSVTVIPGGNRFAPVIAPVANVTLHPGETAAFTLSAADGDGDILTFWSPSLPAGASLNSGSGAFTFTAGATAGTIPVTFSATDGILSSSTSASITVVPWPDTEPTRLSGRVLDAQDFAIGLTTPVAGAAIRIGSQSAISGSDGRFSFNPLDAADAAFVAAIAADGSTAIPASGSTGYGAASASVTVYRNGVNQLAAPILLARRDGSALQLTRVTDTLPPSLRSCRIQRADSAAGGTVSLSSLALTAAEPLPAGTKISIWAANGASYAIAGSAIIAADGLTLANVTGSVPSGTNIVIAPVSLTGRESVLQPKGSYVPSLLGEGNLQTGFSLPSYMSVGQNRAASFLYNSVTANPRPIVTADVTIPAEAALTAALDAELYINGQKAPGVTVTRLDAAERPGTSLPTENADAIASISVSFDASALPTGVYPYKLHVFAGQLCGAGAAIIEGIVFVNNRSASPYGTGWKPSELQQLFPQPDGSVVIEEPNGGLSLYPTGEIAPPYTEGFDGGFGDWSINADGRNLRYLPTQGNPGGAIGADDSVTGDVWYYIAPTTLVDVLRGYLDGRLSFQLRQSSIDSQFDERDIIIFGKDEMGADLLVGYDFNYIPLTTWTSFSAPLSGDGWKIVRQTGGPGTTVYTVLGTPTRDQFRQVLETATKLYIRGEYRTGADTSFLDNIQFLGKDLVGTALLFETPKGHFDSLTANVDGTYIRKYPNGIVAVFNSAGLQTSATDANGNKTEYAYNASGQLASIKDPAGLTTEYLYVSGRLASIIDPDGRLSSFTYNAAGRMTSAVYPDSTTTAYSFDAAGRMTAETDQRNQTVSHFYDAAGRLTQSTMPDGGTVKVELARTLGLQSFGVDLGAPSASKFVALADRVVALADAKGNSAKQEVNEWGAIIRTTDPLGRTTRFERNPDNLVTRIVAPSDTNAGGTLVTELAYDAKGNVASRREAAGAPLQRNTSYQYEPVLNRMTRMVDAGGFATAYLYDVKGNLTRQTNPDGTFTENTYNAQGLILSSKDERGNIATYVYDASGRLSSSADPLGIVRKLTLDGRGNAVASFDAFGTPGVRRVSSSFDSMNRVLTQLNGENEQSLWTYDSAGNILSSADASGITASRAYDAKGRLASLVDPSSGTTIPEYDLNDNITKVRAADRTETLMAYDAVNRVTETVDALGIVRRVAYDSRDNIIAITDGRGSTTTFAYDGLDRQISRTNPTGNVWRFEYDARDLRTAVVKPDGTRVAFAYDSRQRLTSAAVAGQAAALRSYGYDAGDNLVAANASTGAANAVGHAFTYDTRGQMSRASQLASAFGPQWDVDVTHDALARRTLMADTGGARTSYGYDLADRLVSVNAPSGRVITLAYDDAGRRTSVAYSNGLTTSAAFETPAAANGSTGRLKSIAHGLSATGQNGSALNLKLGAFAYSYDVKGNIIAANENASTPRGRAYTLDAIKRLTAVKDGGGASLETYTLDPEGNRIASHKSSFHVTDPANRLQEDEKTQFEYDVNGNMVRKTVKVSGLTWRYGYTVYDELASASRHSSSDPASPALEKVAYVFDALGRRISERRFDAANALTGGMNVHYDGEEAAHETEVNAAGVATAGRWTTHSDGTDDLLAVTLQAGTGPSSPTAVSTGPAMPSASSYYYHTDHQGSVRAITDQSGTVTNSYAYDSYGTAEESVESLAQRFRYTGREFDALTGLYHYRARAYDPETARFLQEDPLWFDGGDLNVYGYVGENPLNLTDPSGMASAAGYASQASIMTGVLTAGTIATRFMLSTGARTAQYLSAANKNNLSAIAGTVACGLFMLADAVSQTGPYALNPAGCGVIAMSEPVAEPEPRTIPVPPQPKKGCTAICRADANDNIPGNLTPGLPNFAFGKATAHSCAQAVKEAKRLATHNLGRQPKHIGCRTSQ
jgi:RHS repeat-associated protein